MVDQKPFGKTRDGKPAHLFHLTNDRGLAADLADYGATLVRLLAPDRKGQPGDVTTGFDSLAGYLDKNPYLGCTVGRCANRVGAGKFTLDGKTIQLATNDGPNHLHGGNVGFDKKLWSASPNEGGDGPSVVFTYRSPDGEENYPGNLDVTVVYTLNTRNELVIDYTARTDAATICNLTNHAYWNLRDAGKTDVLGHVLTVNADRYTPVSETPFGSEPFGSELRAELLRAELLMPTGKLAPVEGTAMDFRTPHAVGERIGRITGGYDHNYVINPDSSGLGTPLALAARLHDPQTGRVLEILTTEPGIQLYTGNFLDGTITGRGGCRYNKHAALCLEAQHFPDSPNHAEFPSIVLRPGQTYRQTTVHRFLTE